MNEETRYYAINPMEGPSALIATPRGEIPRGVLASLFAEQIVSPDFFPPVAPSDETEIPITAIDSSTLRLGETLIPLETPALRSLWNILNAVRYRGDGARGRDFDNLGFGLDDNVNTRRARYIRSLARLAERLNNADGGETIFWRQPLRPGNGFTYHLTPRLVFSASAELEGKPEIANAIYGPLIQYPAQDTIAPPYTSQEPIQMYINNGKVIERDDLAWTLSDNERALLTILRLHPEPLTLSEIAELGFHSQNPASAPKEVRRAAHNLNNLFAPGGQDVIVVDRLAALATSIRVARPVTFIDRRAGIPATEDRISTLRQAIQAIVAAGQTELPPLPQKRVSPRPSPSADQRALLSLLSPLAISEGILAPREIFELSLRFGVWLPQLKDMIVVGAKGRRIYYKDFQAQLQAGQAFTLRAIGHLAGFQAPNIGAAPIFAPRLPKLHNLYEELRERKDLRAMLIADEAISLEEKLRRWESGAALGELLGLLNYHSPSGHNSLLAFMRPGDTGGFISLTQGREALPALRKLLQTVHKALNDGHCLHAAPELFLRYDEACNNLWKIIGRPNVISQSFSQVAASDKQFAQSGSQSLAEIISLLTIVAKNG